MKRHAQAWVMALIGLMVGCSTITGQERGGEEGEEGGTPIAITETWDQTRKGVRLILRYDSTQDAFTGTAHNTTGATVCAVRVEVHLIGGSELGPTPRTDIVAGATILVRLPVAGESFTQWVAHPEVSTC